MASGEETMTTAQILTLLIGGGGIGALIKVATDGLKAWRTGRATAEQHRNRTLLERVADAERRADDAEDEADAESAYRRILQEYASRLRRLLIDCGVPEDRLPPWPGRPSE